MKTFLAITVLATLTGCAHSTMRGSVAMKASDTEGHVCLGDNEVRTGDRVALFKNVCTGTKASRLNDGGNLGCTKNKLGEGTIERVLNSHYSVMQADPGVTFEEGTVVEKL